MPCSSEIGIIESRAEIGMISLGTSARGFLLTFHTSAPESVNSIPSLSILQFKELLFNKIQALNIESAKADVTPFVADPHELDIWSTDYFSQLAGMMKIQN